MGTEVKEAGAVSPPVSTLVGANHDMAIETGLLPPLERSHGFHSYGTWAVGPVNTVISRRIEEENAKAAQGL